MTESVKTCIGCGETKPITKFRRRGSTSPHLYRSYCKACLYKKHRDWVEGNPSRIAEYRTRNPWTMAKRCARYGITPEQLVSRYETQKGCCAICKIKIPLMDSAIDHNHNTGEFRGVLCKKCNRALGMFSDSPTVLRNAIEYLEAFGSYGDGD